MRIVIEAAARIASSVGEGSAGEARRGTAAGPAGAAARRAARGLVLGVVALAALGGCTSTLYTETDDEVRLHAGMGGLVVPILARYAAWDAAGKRIVIDGHVVSADAFGAFSAKNVCYTENAVFSPHAASHFGLVPYPAATDQLASMLPDPLEAWFRGDVAYRDWIGFARMEFPELAALWPEGACAEDLEAALAADALRRALERPTPIDR